MTVTCKRCKRDISEGIESRGAYGYKYLCQPCTNSLNPNFEGVKQEIRKHTKDIDHLRVVGD